MGSRASLDCRRCPFDLGQSGVLNASLARMLRPIPKGGGGVSTMSTCASCGQPLVDEGGLCAHHYSDSEDGWAASNRLMCDFIHRKRIPLRLSFERRSDGVWTHLEAA
jgi:hypothetical protein